MSNPAAAPAQPQHPDPNRAASARLDPAGVGNILHPLHTLVAYGRNLVQTLRQEHDPDDLPWYAFLTRIFGTTNPALITVLIIRGLLRAAALQAQLSKSLTSLSRLPLPARAAGQTKAEGRGLSRGHSPRKPRVVGWAIPPDWPAGDPSLDRLPRPEQEMFAELIEQDRDRPLGAILLDVCLDLGLAPALMDPAAWDDLRLAISLHGGDPAPLEARSVDSANPPGTAERKSGAHSANSPPNLTDNPIPAADSPTADHRSQTIGYRVSPMAAAIPSIPAPRRHRPTPNRPPGETDRLCLTRDRPTAGPAVPLASCQHLSRSRPEIQTEPLTRRCEMSARQLALVWLAPLEFVQRRHGHHPKYRRREDAALPPGGPRRRRRGDRDCKDRQAAGAPHAAGECGTPDLARRSRFRGLSISLVHAARAGSLGGPHRDPFDRMLIAQAQTELAVLVTADPAFRTYNIPVIHAAAATPASP